MPFVESSRMEQRVGLLSDYDTGAFSVTALCARYGIDRSTFTCGCRVGMGVMRCGSQIARMRRAAVRIGRWRRWKRR
jgi:hypothetical protein